MKTVIILILCITQILLAEEVHSKSRNNMLSDSELRFKDLEMYNLDGILNFEPVMGVLFSSSYIHSTKGVDQRGFDINGTFLMFNFSIDVTNLKADFSKDEDYFGAFIGGGLAHMIQLQIGLFNNSKIIRIRGNIPLIWGPAPMTYPKYRSKFRGFRFTPVISLFYDYKYNEERFGISFGILW